MTQPDAFEDNFKPSSEDDVLQVVQAALSGQHPLEIIGHGSKRNFGHTVKAQWQMDLSALSGVTMFEPDELVMTQKPERRLPRSIPCWKSKIRNCNSNP